MSGILAPKAIIVKTGAMVQNIAFASSGSSSGMPLVSEAITRRMPSFGKTSLMNIGSRFTPVSKSPLKIRRNFQASGPRDVPITQRRIRRIFSSGVSAASASAFSSSIGRMSWWAAMSAFSKSPLRLPKW